ncbi:MAG TPA: hypothetical protein VK427_26575, partial [Kofleriaceae bacterium]|nr:hypothetical protein [Kofleriaceae bacterium]
GGGAALIVDIGDTVASGAGGVAGEVVFEALDPQPSAAAQQSPNQFIDDERTVPCVYETKA